LLCGNKRDWDKKKKCEVSNRVLYFALLDIVDKQTNPHHYAEKAKSGVTPGYKDDVASDVNDTIDYFDDDIIVRFVAFVRTVYGEATLEDNLAFIADTLYPDKDGFARDKIRRYFGAISIKTTSRFTIRSRFTGSSIRASRAGSRCRFT
jgi:hypothetical protein